MLPVHSLVRLAMVAVASGGGGGGGGRRVPELLTEWLTRRPSRNFYTQMSPSSAGRKTRGDNMCYNLSPRLQPLVCYCQMMVLDVCLRVFDVCLEFFR